MAAIWVALAAGSATRFGIWDGSGGTAPDRHYFAAPDLAASSFSRVLATSARVGGGAVVE